MKRFLTTSIVLLLASASIANAAERPNIIVVFTDDHGYADLSSQSIVKDIATPHIDALAEQGVRMTAGYVTAPQCVPSRAGLLSGRYQNRFGVESNKKPLDGFNRQLTIAERLKKAGYATGMTGKWHLGPHQEVATHGFDDVYVKQANRPGWANFNLDGTNREPGREDSKLYHLDANSAAACAFIKRHHDEPFFFYCAYRAPHVPLDAPPKYLKRFPGEMPERRRQALAMMSAVDDGLGQIVQTLRRYDLEEKTLIFFIGDNGAPLKIHKLDEPGGGPGWDGSLNEPLNGEKGMLSEGGIRVPFVVSWKGRIPAGQIYDQPVISLDVAATAATLAGVPDDELDGVNLMPHLTGENAVAPHAVLYWRWIAQSAVREGKWKYLRGGAREYLFDLDDDREEQHNLLAKHPDVAQRLKAKLAKWAGELQPPGLETTGMSTTWETYYDHYLDGKPAPRPRTPTRPDRKVTDARLGGWVVRGGTATVKDGALIVQSNDATKPPFIARTSLKLAGPVVAKVQLRSSQRGKVGISWREAGQKDFPSGQTSTITIGPSDAWREVELNVPVITSAIHVRLLLPGGTSTIRRIELHDANDRTTRFQFAGSTK